METERVVAALDALAIQNVLLLVSMLAAGFLLGIEFTVGVVLAHQQPLAEPAWLDAVRSARYVMFGAVGVGFGSVLALEWRKK